MMKITAESLDPERYSVHTITDRLGVIEKDTALDKWVFSPDSSCERLTASELRIIAFRIDVLCERS